MLLLREHLLCNVSCISLIIHKLPSKKTTQNIPSLRTKQNDNFSNKTGSISLPL